MPVLTKVLNSTDYDEVLALPLSPVLFELSFIEENNFEQVNIPI